MWKHLLHIFNSFPVVLSSFSLVSNASTIAQASEKIDRYKYEIQNNPMSQVTEVKQLQDVSPDDWAYEVLRSLVERYGCLKGYPDLTFRGNRPLSRWEFTAALNACLNVIERLLQENVAVLREDIDKLRRLAQDFDAELTVLGTRIDNLESRTAFLEDHQFSTTTKLKGEVIFALVGQGSDSGEKFDGSQQRIDRQFTLSNRFRLVLNTSFTGKDVLITRFQAGTIPRLDRAFGTDMARLGFDASNDNDVEINRLYYRTLIGERITTWVGTSGLSIDNIFDVLNPFLASSGTGALSRFSRRNPFVYRGPEGSGGAINYEFNDNFGLTALYLTNSNDGANPMSGKGLFNGPFSTGAQIDYYPTDTLNLAFTYLHTYFPQEEVNLTSSTGSNLVENIANEIGFAGSRDPFNGAATTSDNFGIQSSWRITKGINWVGWVGYANATGQSTDNTGINRKDDTATLWNWNTNFSFIDVGKQGAVFSIGGGMLPRASRVEGGGQDANTSHIVEALYRYPLTDSITITPGGYIIFNANGGNNNNDSLYVGVIRATFKFPSKR